MRKPIIAGNWKMYKTSSEALSFVNDVKDHLPSASLVDSVICSPFPFLKELVENQGEVLRIGAQNMHFNLEGAFTGEVSPKMLTDLNVTYVIIGHSERRAMFNETDEAINKKLHVAFEYGLTPILCIGESLEVRESGKTFDLLQEQLTADLKDLDSELIKKLVIAYEPIWAIGTGKTATSLQAEEACQFIRTFVEKLYSKEVADAIRIQYGGSVKTSNIEELMAQPDIDGALIGGASLDAKNFLFFTEVASR